MSLPGSNDEAIHNLICDKVWTAHWWATSWFQLNSDGTGEIVSLAELCVIIIAHFTWTIVEQQLIDYSPQQPTTKPRELLENTFNLAPRPHKALTATLEITLNRSRETPRTVTPRVGETAENTEVGARYLTDDALKPRQFTISVERGVFPDPPPVFLDGSKSLADGIKSSSRYGLQMVFDKSPFPEKEGWTVNIDKRVVVPPYNWVKFVTDPLRDEFNGRGGDNCSLT